MRTTIDLPAELLERARTAATERGISFAELVSEAIAAILPFRASRGEARAPARRASFPIFASREPGTLHLTSEDLARAEADEDRRRHGLAD